MPTGNIPAQGSGGKVEHGYKGNYKHKVCTNPRAQHGTLLPDALIQLHFLAGQDPPEGDVS